MLESGGECDLPEKSVGANRVGQLGQQDFECNPPVVPKIASQVDGSHATVPQLPLDRVVFRESRLEALRRQGHPLPNARIHTIPLLIGDRKMAIALGL